MKVPGRLKRRLRAAAKAGVLSLVVWAAPPPRPARRLPDVPVVRAVANDWTDGVAVASMFLLFPGRRANVAGGGTAQWPAAPAFYNAPVGLTLNRSTGAWEGTTITTAYVEPGTSETFVDTGNATTNMTNLQNTLNTWAGGTPVRKKLIVPAGTQFSGNLTLPVNTASGWVSIDVQGYADPASPPSSSTGLFIIESPNTNPAIQTTTAGGVTTAHGRYAFRGAEIRFVSSLSTSVDTGPLSIMRFGDFSTQSSASRQPDGLYLAGCWIHGWADKHCRRGLDSQGSNVHLYQTRIDEIHNQPAVSPTGGDSQCFICWNGTGPIRLDTCVLSGGAECFVIGGGDCYVGVPSDIHLRKVRFVKPNNMLTANGGNGWLAKNDFETKNGRRILLEQCLGEGFPTWGDAAQQTFCVAKVSRHAGPVVEVLEDLLCYNCGSDRVPQMMGLLKDLGTNSPTRVAVVNYLGVRMNESPDAAPINAPVLAWNSGSPTDIYFDHIGCYTNTGEDGSAALRMLGTAPLTNFTLKNSLLECNGTSPGGVGGIWDGSQGSTTLTNKCAGTVTVGTTMFLGAGTSGQLAGYPTGCTGETYANTFVAHASRDYTLKVGSAAIAGATDGTDLGPHNYAALKALLDAVPT